MRKRELKKSAKEAGMSYRKYRNSQWDDEPFPGKPGGRVRKFRKRFSGGIMATMLTTSPILVVGTLATIGYMTNAETRPLGFYDMSGNGIRDPIIAFPIKHTDKAVIGYDDGKRFPENLGRYPIDINAFLANFNGFEVVDQKYSDYRGQTVIEEYDEDGDGLANGVKVWRSGCFMWRGPKFPPYQIAYLEFEKERRID